MKRVTVAVSESDIAKLIDHTLLKADATADEIGRLCTEAKDFGFHSVCINPFFVPLAKNQLAGSGTKVTTVVAFPLGANATKGKVYEALEASLSGADELDIVMNLGLAKAGQWDAVEKDIADVIAATGGLVHKIIIEACLLSEAQKKKAAEVVLHVRAEFVKTSTGMGCSGAEIDDVRLIRTVVGDRCGIKAAGGIRSLARLKEFIAAGATRIGTSSGVDIMKEMRGTEK